MGIIFPNDPANPSEHPDHKSIPSPVGEAIRPIGFAMAAGVASALPLCPEAHHHQLHLPHVEFQQGTELPAGTFMASGANSSTSGVPFGWNEGNSMDVAAQIIRDGARRRRVMGIHSFDGPPLVLKSTEEI